MRIGYQAYLNILIRERPAINNSQQPGVIICRCLGIFVLHLSKVSYEKIFYFSCFSWWRHLGVLLVCISAANPRIIKVPKQGPDSLEKHSDSFNLQVDRVIDAYILAKDALVNDDTAMARQQVGRMISMLDSLPLDELKKDTAGILNGQSQYRRYQIKRGIHVCLSRISAKCGAILKAMTDVMYPSFFKSINYEGKKLFLQHCPMAFREDQGADWISNSEEIVNPYLGKEPSRL